MKKETPFERKNCYDCNHLIHALSWWCRNEKAIRARSTRIPGCIHCPYWEPDWKYIDKKYKTKEYGYITLWGKFKDWIKFLLNDYNIIKKL